MSFGRDRVRAAINPSANVATQIVKSKTAELIDFLNEEPQASEEKIRLIEIAMQKYEEAAMWAVKALTA